MMFRLASGRGLAYQTCGKGPCVVLLHPIGLDGSFWDEVVPTLSERWRIITVDLPGHGASDVPNPSPSLSDLGDDIAELIASIGQPPVALVGCSLGGMIAQAVALGYPNLVAALVLANTSHDRDEPSRAALHKRAEKALGGMPEVVDETLERWFDRAYWVSHPDKVDRLRRKLEAADPVVHAWMWHAIADLNHGSRLRSLSQNTLVVAGSEDNSVSATATDAMTRDLAYVEAITLTAGHLTPFERPEEFTSAVSEFLARNLTSNRTIKDTP